LQGHGSRRRHEPVFRHSPWWAIMSACLCSIFVMYAFGTSVAGGSKPWIAAFLILAAVIAVVGIVYLLIRLSAADGRSRACSNCRSVLLEPRSTWGRARCRSFSPLVTVDDTGFASSAPRPPAASGGRPQRWSAVGRPDGPFLTSVGARLLACGTIRNRGDESDRSIFRLS
jgi:hypothetical protein